MTIGDIPTDKSLMVCAATCFIAIILSVASGASVPCFEKTVTSGESTAPKTYISLNSPSVYAAATRIITTTTDTITMKSCVTSQSSALTTYQQSFPDLYCDKPSICIVQSKIVYLTFDDGPSQQTPKILKILKENGIKATFFVVGKSDDYSKRIMKQIVDDGHTIGLHSYSHDYKKVYKSVQAFLEDYNALNTLVYKASGTKPNIFRFPGGSINDFNRNIYPAIIAEMYRRGYTYFDWNVSSVDTDPNATVNSVYKNIVGPAERNKRSIVLMHDTKPIVADALDSIIKELQKQGYTFSSLSNEVKPVIF